MSQFAARFAEYGIAYVGPKNDTYINKWANAEASFFP